MQLKEFKPSADLVSYVESYRLIESRDGNINRVLPGTSFSLAFSLRGNVSYEHPGSSTPLPPVTLSGLRKSVRLINYAPQARTLIVLFNPTGAAALIKHPLNELFETSVPLDTFFRTSEIAEIRDKLSEAENDRERINVVENFLRAKLPNPTPDKLIEEAVALIRRSNGVIGITALAKSLYISHDAFEKRFRRFTGATPKQFSMIVRMNAITRITSPASFLDVAIENGYYDQAHFNKDFKRYTGLTPSAFFASAAFW